MPYRFSPLTDIPPSATLTMNTLAQQKKASGILVHNLTIGEPVLSTPEPILRAATQAMQAGKTLYTPPAGIPELREAAAAWMRDAYAASYAMGETIVTCGGKFGLYLLFQALLEPDDEVLIGTPYWVSYPPMVEIFGGVPMMVPTEEKIWKLTPEILERFVTSKTKLLLLNNGGNPTGVVYDREEIKNLLRFAQERNLFVISDEVYSGLTYDGREYVSAGSFPEFRDRVMVVQSCSKHFAMTGWRVGFVFAPKEIIGVLTTLQGQSTSGTASISQWAGLAAVQGWATIISMICHAMEERRNVFIETFSRIAGAQFPSPSAGLYMFVSLRDMGVSSPDDVAFCTKALEEGNVALVPGSAFGAPGYVRASFGGKKEDTVAALAALEKYLKP